MTIDEQLQLLDEWLRQLKIEYDMFFGGGRKLPPYDLKMRIEKAIKRLLEERGMSYAQRFRYSNLAARYNSYQEMWRRITAQREEGRFAERPSALDGEAQPYIEDALSISISSPEAEESKIQDLYRFLSAARQRLGGNPAPPYDAFKQFIVAKTDSVKKQLGCQAVTFSLKVEEGKLRLTAQKG